MIARLVVVQLTSAMIVLGIPALAPFLRAEFDLSRSQVGLLTTAVFLGVVLASWKTGSIVDSTGPRRALLIAAIGLGSGFAALALGGSFVSILAILFLTGVFYSAVTPATNAGIVEWASSAFRKRAMAIKQMGVTAGAAVTAAVLPFIVLATGWRVGVVVVGAVTVVVGVAAASGLASRRARQSESDDRGTGNVAALGMAALMFLFVQHSVASHFLIALQDEGVALASAGLALSALQISATGGRYLWAWLADRTLGGNTIAAMLIVSACSAAALTSVTLFGLRSAFLGAVLLGVTTQAGNGLLQSVLAEAGGSRPGTSSGIGMSFGFFGTVIGPPLFGLAADTWSYRSSWVLLAAVALAGGLLVWRADRSQQTARTATLA